MGGERRFRVGSFLVAWLRTSSLLVYERMDRLDWLEKPVTDEGMDMAWSDPSELLGDAFGVCLRVGLVVSYPVLAMQRYWFRVPGMHAHEAKRRRGGRLVSGIGTRRSLWRCQYVVAPRSWQFFFEMVEDVEELVSLPRLVHYIAWWKVWRLGCITRMHSPVRIGVLRQDVFVRRLKMNGVRKLWMRFSLVVGAVITPPDVLSQLIVAGPMVVRMEIGIFIKCYQLSKNAMPVTRG